MAINANTVNSRIGNLRGEASAAARAVATHQSRLAKARETLETALDELAMWKTNKKATVTDAEQAFDEALSAIVENSDGIDFDALTALLEDGPKVATEPEQETESTDASADAETTTTDADVSDEAPRPRRARRADRVEATA